MKKDTKTITLDGANCSVELLLIEESDRTELRKLYKTWRTLTEGMKQFESRGTNLPEGLSEGAFCLNYNSAKVLAVNGPASSSFDTLDLKTYKRQQIKASSVENELTSFGPKSVWDELYFLDFYRDGQFDFKFDVYLISNEAVYNLIVNQGKGETFRDQQSQGRRPRFSIKKEIILPNKLSPLKTCSI